jgi:antagonist of KipI
MIVRRPGMLTTVQDTGRWGYQHCGMPVAGSMDTYSQRAANLLVGNDADAGVLEVTLLGPELQFDSESFVAVAGAKFAMEVDGRPLPFHTGTRLGAGSVLKFGARRSGARAYLAVSGGIRTPSVMGSRATHVPSHTGGLQGRALKAGDVLPIGEEKGTPSRPSPLELPTGIAVLRVMTGPHTDRFDAGVLDQLASAVFRVSPQSNRIGYRLEGARIEPKAGAGELISVSMPPGGIQVPRSGEPILLMADRGTTGGYPVVAVVISADFPIAGQLAPGDSLRFARCSADEALDALRVQEAALLTG